MASVLTKAIIHRALLFGAGWCVLVRADPAGLLLGVVMVPFAIRLSLSLLPARHPLDLWRVVLHLPRFIRGSIIGGLDVARRAFSPRLPLRPGWQRVPVDLPAGASVVLGAELSLMPGTLPAGTHDGQLVVHLLDTRGGFDQSIEEEQAQIAAMLGQPGDQPT